MTTATSSLPASIAVPETRAPASASGALTARASMILVLMVAVVTGWLATGEDATTRAVAAAGDDLVRLLRSMAALKALIALGAAAALVWRLGAPVSRARFALYAVAAAAMAAGPGVIWGMAYVRTGAMLLHAGLAVVAVTLWRDPAVGERLAGVLRRRSSFEDGGVPPGPAQR